MCWLTVNILNPKFPNSNRCYLQQKLASSQTFKSAWLFKIWTLHAFLNSFQLCICDNWKRQCSCIQLWLWKTECEAIWWWGSLFTSFISNLRMWLQHQLEWFQVSLIKISFFFFKIDHLHQSKQPNSGQELRWIHAVQ